MAHRTERFGKWSDRRIGAMSHKKTWLITGSSRGMGVDFAKAALAAGHAVVASGRDNAQAALGARHLDLLNRDLSTSLAFG